ncbi:MULTISPECIES: S49 family peptidase [unclassified Ensifer]|uniref:S49 family peptidase n=1 Tax=unclassified Ensifer TaxID=2633371 RepID=UPI000812DF54|nr:MULTISPECIES: S49 family peptidase [unclassified Ensifer]OCP07977.1 hypothetical protein BC362_10225 [Ensifer sp. LC14]OCP10913.1 hypothetical protein BC374_17740 [Ensifer sp. LC13]OCP11541.1 hypothetical protein BBX50_18115 [Ensifer sp. LC11]OCP33360.1 hypothetical protein BC364_17005 [Ensifer sp. LC499]
MRFFNRLRSSGEPWLLTPEAFRAMSEAAAEQDTTIRAIAKEWGEPEEGTWDVEVHNGVAVVKVDGVLMRNWSIWSFLFGGSAYELLIKDIATAIKDDNIKAIVLDIDSPGGEVTGCAELANAIFEMRSQKPIIAYATGTAASAAYWIASSCSKVIISSTSALGSIGCVMEVSDYSSAREKAGIKDIQIVSSQSPLKRPDLSTDEGLSTVQAHVDAIAAVFIADVAKFRGVSIKRVSEDFGKGDCFIGQAAVDAGLADEIGSLEAVIAEYGIEQQATPTVGVPADTGGNGMLKAIAKATKKTAKIAAKAKAEEQDQEAEDEEIDPEAEDDVDTDAEGEDVDPDAEGEEDVDAEDEDLDPDAEDEEVDPDAEDEEEQPVSNKASAAQKRIAAILRAPEASGRRKLAEHLALNTHLSSKAARSILKASPKAQAASGNSKASSSFRSAMLAKGNPKIGNGTGKGKTMSAEDKAVDAILASVDQLRGK